MFACFEHRVLCNSHIDAQRVRQMIIEVSCYVLCSAAKVKGLPFLKSTGREISVDYVSDISF